MNEKLRKIVIWVLLLSLILSLVPAVVFSAFADDVHSWAESAEEPKTHSCTAEGCVVHTAHPADYSEPMIEDGKHYLKCRDCTLKIPSDSHDFSRTVIAEQYLASPVSTDEATPTKYYYSCECGAASKDHTNTTFDTFHITFDIGTRSFTEGEDANAGFISGMDILSGEKVTGAPEPKIDQFRFEKWVYYNDKAEVGDPAKAHAFLSEDASPASAPITKNMTVYALGTDLYAVNVTPNTTCKITVEDETGAVTGPVEAGTTITVSVAPKTGYRFAELDLTSTAGGMDITPVGELTNVWTFTMPRGDVTLTVTTGPIALNDFSLDAASLSLFVGNGVKKLNTVFPTNFPEEYRTVTWTSSDTAVATVDEEGNVTAVSQGDAVITATTVDAKTNYGLTGENLTATCNVTVSRLFVPDAQYNDGLTEVPFTKTITVTLENGSFAAQTGNYPAGIVSVANLPAGLSSAAALEEGKIVITISGTPTTATTESAQLAITVKGSAITDAPADAVYKVVTDPSGRDITCQIKQSYVLSKSASNCTVTLTAPSSGTAGSTMRVPANAEVTVQVTPNDEYSFVSLKVTKDGTTDVIELDGPSAKFQMPAGNATVTAVCKINQFACTADPIVTAVSMPSASDFIEASVDPQDLPAGTSAQLEFNLDKVSQITALYNQSYKDGYSRKSSKDIYLQGSLLLKAVNDATHAESIIEAIPQVDAANAVNVTVNISGITGPSSGYYRTWRVYYMKPNGEIGYIGSDALVGKVNQYTVTFPMQYFNPNSPYARAASDTVPTYLVTFRDVYSNGNPTTGDNFNPGIAALAMVLSLIGCAGVIHMNKRDEF